MISRFVILLRYRVVLGSYVFSDRHRKYDLNFLLRMILYCSLIVLLYCFLFN